MRHSQAQAAPPPPTKADETRQKIERAALQLFVERGITETPTREIAARAGIAEGTIYRHFESKEALAQALFERHHTRLARALEEAHAPHRTLAQKIPAIVECYCRFADEDWPLFAYHLLSMHLFLARLPERSPNPLNVVRDVLAEARKRGEVAVDNLELATAMVVGMILQPAFHKVYGALDLPLRDQVPYFSQSIARLLRIAP